MNIITLKGDVVLNNLQQNTEFGLPNKYTALEHPQPTTASSTPAPSANACACMLSYDDWRLIMDRLPLPLLYLSKEFNVKSTTKDIKTIHTKLI
jgi:hypothetical protein